jgi:hypothetical protein
MSGLLRLGLRTSREHCSFSQFSLLSNAVRQTGNRQANFGTSFFHSRSHNTPLSSGFSGRQQALQLKNQMRFKSIFQHRFFHPETSSGKPSYRVFWTVSLLLGGFSVVYLQWIDPYLKSQYDANQAGKAAAPLSDEPVFDKDNFTPLVIKKIEPYNWNTKL